MGEIELGGVTVKQAMLGMTYFQKGLAGVPMNYLDFLDVIAEEDVVGLKKAEKSYGDSWKKRGGVGAFMMLARKWDRFETRVQQALPPLPEHPEIFPFDVFSHMEADTRDEGIIDDIRDLRRYLMLIEAEIRSRNA